MLSKSLLGTIFLICFELANATSLESIRLFNERGNYVFGYNRKMKKIMNHFDSGNKEALELVFSNGHKFTVYSILGRGDFFNVVFDIGNNQVLRVRQTKKQIFSFSFFMLYNAPMFDSFHAYKQGYNILKPMNLPLAESYFTNTNDHEFLVQERLEIDYFYTDYVYDDLRDDIPKEDLEKMDKDFIEFVKKTARLSLILDMRDENIIYSKRRGWVLLDFWDDIRKADSYEDSNIFETSSFDHIETRARTLIKDGGGVAKPILSKPGLPRHIAAEAKKAIAQERLKYFKPSCAQSSALSSIKKSFRNSILGLRLLTQSHSR